MRFFVLLLLLLLTLDANHINWHGDFDKAHKKSIKENKKLMVLLIEKDCDLSQKTIQTIFMNHPYIDKINSEFISILVTKDQKSSYPIEMLYTYTYPTLFFLDNKELFLYEPIRGDITPDKLKSYLK